MTKTYTVAEGVSWVNGQAVPESREMKLTAKEALFDLNQGRITLKADDLPVAEDGTGTVLPDIQEPAVEREAHAADVAVGPEPVETRKARR